MIREKVSLIRSIVSANKSWKQNNLEIAAEMRLISKAAVILSANRLTTDLIDSIDSASEGLIASIVAWATAAQLSEMVVFVASISIALSATDVIPSMVEAEISGFIDSAIRFMLLDMDSETALA